MKYKVGDKVRIKSLDWYNKNKDEYGNIDISYDFTFYADRSKYCGKVFTISEVFANSYFVKEDNKEYYWSDEMIEGLVEEEAKPIDFTIKATDTKGKVEVVIPEGYSYVIENDKLYFITEKKEVTYPKTYAECSDILSVYTDPDISGYKGELLWTFQKLLVCRDAYWKIAGEEMGLGKPWKPDWTNLECDKFCIWVDVGDITLRDVFRCQHILAFPTAEMRDAFYENFKELIEQCKELL